MPFGDGGDSLTAEQRQHQAAQLDPACWQHLPVCIGAILRAPAVPAPDGSASYQIGKKLVRKIDVIGLCRAASEFDSYYKCLIDDGTGAINCTLWKPRQPPPPTLHSFRAARQPDGVAMATGAGSYYGVDSSDVTSGGPAPVVGLTTLGAEDSLAELLLAEAKAAQPAPGPGLALHARGVVREFRGNRELSCGYHRVAGPGEELQRLSRLAVLADPSCQFGYGLRLRLPEGLSRQLCLAQATRDREAQSQERLLDHLRSSRLHQFTLSDLQLSADWLPSADGQSIRSTLLDPLVSSGHLRSWLCEDTGRRLYQLCEADRRLRADIVDALRQMRDASLSSAAASASASGVSELALLGRLRRERRGCYPGLTETALRRLLDRMVEDSQIVCSGPRTYACV